MSLVKKSLSVFGKLSIVLLLLVAFSGGMGAVLYLALRSPEVTVPEIVGKDYLAGEQELASLELKIRKRTDRFSEEKPNTILEQIPRSGDMVKAGQTISVVVSRAQAEGDEKPAEVKKTKPDDKPKDVDEPTEVDKARQKRKAANRNANANKNGNSNSNTNANSSANSASNANGAGNSNSSSTNGAANTANRTTNNSNSRPNTNGGGTNSNARPANANANSRGTTAPAANRNSNSGTRPAESNRRPN